MNNKPNNNKPVRAHAGLALALGSALLLSACLGESAQDLVKSAKVQMDKKDYKAAVIQLKNALQKDESLAEARYLLARALLDAGDVSGAAIEAGKVKGYDSDGFKALQARLLLMQGKSDELIKQFGTVHLASPADEADLQISLAGAHIGKNQLPAARQAVDAALKADPERAASRLVHIRLLTSEGKLPEARAELDKLLEKLPDNAEAWQLKGELLQMAEAPAADTIAAYRKALSLNKTEVGAHNGLVSVLLKSGDRAAAKDALAAMKAAAPNHPQTRYYAAAFALDENQLKDATEQVQQLLKLAPDNDRALHLAGMVALRNGDLRQAESYLAKAVQASPGQAPARVALAQVQLRTGDAEQALATLKPLLDDKKRATPEALGLAAEIKLKQGQGEQSEALLARVAELRPDDARSRVGLALAQIRKGQEAQGMAALRKLAADSAAAEPDMALISVLLGKKDFDGALQAIAGLERKRPQSALAPELRGRVALFRGNREQARKEFLEAIQREPRAIAAANSLAVLDLQDKKPAQAAQRYDAALKADPKDLRARMAQIGVQLSNKLLSQEDILKRLGEVIKDHPTAPTPRLAQISLLMERKDNKAALTAAQEAVAAAPEQGELLDALAQVQLANGDRQLAISNFGKVSNLMPNSPLGPLRLADLYIRNGDKSLAMTQLRRAQSIAPGDPELASQVADKALALEQPELAQTAAKALQAANPRSPIGWKIEGDVARSRRDWPGAIAAYRKAEQLGQPTVRQAIAMHTVLVMGGREDEAKAYAAAWTARHKGDVLFTYHLGDVALSKKRYDQAEQHYQAVLQLAADNASAANNVAWLRHRAGQADALGYAEKANQLNPGAPPYMDTLAEILAARGQWDKAITVQKEAVRLDPKTPAFRLRLAQIYAGAGKKAEAQAELKPLADLGPKFEQQAEVQKLQAALR